MNYLKNNSLYKRQMLCYDRINAFKGIDVNKTSKLKEWNIYH